MEEKVAVRGNRPVGLVDEKFEPVDRFPEGLHVGKEDIPDVFGKLPSLQGLELFDVLVKLDQGIIGKIDILLDGGNSLLDILRNLPGILLLAVEEGEITIGAGKKNLVRHMRHRPAIDKGLAGIGGVLDLGTGEKLVLRQDMALDEEVDDLLVRKDRNGVDGRLEIGQTPSLRFRPR